MADASASGFTEETVKPGRTPPRLKIESAWASPISVWTPPTMRAALDSHEQGQFYTSAALADWCWRDAVFAGAMRTRVHALSSRSALPFTVEAGDGDGRSRKAIRDRVEQLWWTSIPESVLAPILIDAISPGAALGVIRWLRLPDEWIPFLHHLPLHGLEHVVEEDRYVYHTADGQTLDVTPGDGRWFLHLPYGPRSYLYGALRSVAAPVLGRAYDNRDMSRGNEKHGLPLLAIEEPFFAHDDVEGATGAGGSNALAFYRQFRAGIGSETVLRLPQGQGPDGGGWKAEWKELKASPNQGFVASLKSREAEIQLAILGRADAGSKGGDGELASERLRIEGLASDAETLSTTIRNQIWKPYVAFNYSPDDIENAPWGRWNTRPPTDLKARADMLDKMADAAGKLKPLGAAMGPIFAEFQVTAVETKGDEPVPPEPPPAPPAPDPPPAPPAPAPAAEPIPDEAA